VKLLLDTHTVLWWLDAPASLGLKSFNCIADPRNEVVISPVVPWEIALKANKHRQIPHRLLIFTMFSGRKALPPSASTRFTPFALVCCRFTNAIRSTDSLPRRRLQ
jgi:hypothetical protein